MASASRNITLLERTDNALNQPFKLHAHNSTWLVQVNLFKEASHMSSERIYPFLTLVQLKGKMVDNPTLYRGIRIVANMLVTRVSLIVKKRAVS
jgi:hypothetical protein